MKSTFVAAVLALAVPAVYAQVPGLPGCASPCLLNNLSKSGCENPTDFKCVCASDPFISAASGCIASSCPAEDIPTAIGAAYKLCQSFGVTIPTTVPEAPATTSTPEAVTSTPTAPTTTTEVSTVVSETTILSETTIAVTYPVTTLTTAVTTTTLVGTGDVTPTGNSSTPTIAPPPTNSDSAAVKNVAGLGAMVMAVAGFFAL